MSIGNLKTEGNKGNNFPYQLRTLQLLGSINDGISADSNGVTRTTNLLRVTLASGTVAAGTYGASFASVGTANATVKGITLKPGETINFNPGGINNVLDAIAYDASPANAELLIIYLT